MKYSVGKIVTLAALGVLVLVTAFLLIFTETADYWSAVCKNTVVSYVEFLDDYPDSRHKASVDQRKALLEDDYFLKKKEKNTIRAYDEFLHAYPQGEHTPEATFLRDSLLQIELDIEKYGNNVLAHGSAPYSSFFGENRTAQKKHYSDVEVVAPIGFDMVAIIKEQNEDGRVVAHAYVQADSTYTFKIDNGRYQMFFYIGKGWKPGKKMKDGVLGGFVRNETYSKDDPVSLANEVITYQVSMKERDKFKRSSRQEMFR